MKQRQSETLENIREARRMRGVSRKTASIMATAMVAMMVFGGYAFAAGVLNTQSVTQKVGSYDVSSGALANWPNPPTLNIGQGTLNSCSSTVGQSWAGTGSWTLGINGSVCKSGDFVEVWSITSVVASYTGPTNMTVYASWIGMPLTGAGSALLPFTGTTAAGTLTLKIDFGQVQAPDLTTFQLLIN